MLYAVGFNLIFSCFFAVLYYGIPTIDLLVQWTTENSGFFRKIHISMESMEFSGG